jgi:hypothetical protein
MKRYYFLLIFVCVTIINGSEKDPLCVPSGVKTCWDQEDKAKFLAAYEQVSQLLLLSHEKLESFKAKRLRFTGRDMRGATKELTDFAASLDRDIQRLIPWKILNPKPAEQEFSTREEKEFCAEEQMCCCIVS